MFMTETSRFSPLTPFRHAGKHKNPAKNLELISRAFDENLLRRLKPLVYKPSLDLSWLSLAVDLLSSTHAEAEALISDLQACSGLDESLKSYLDDSVKVLDICNAINSEIERLRNSRMLINFVLHLLDFSGEVPSPEKLRRARKSLSEWLNPAPIVKKRNRDRPNPAVLIGELEVRLRNPPRGKISSVGKLVEHTIYSVGALTVFVCSVVLPIFTGSQVTVAIRVPGEFFWADSFNGLESTMRKLCSAEKVRLLGELDDVEARVNRICHVIDELTKRNDVIGGEDKFQLESAVKELATAMGTFSEGLDSLSNGVNSFFHTVLCTRNSLLSNFRVGPHTELSKNR